MGVLGQNLIEWDLCYWDPGESGDPVNQDEIPGNRIFYI